MWVERGDMVRGTTAPTVAANAAHRPQADLVPDGRRRRLC